MGSPQAGKPQPQATSGGGLEKQTFKTPFFSSGTRGESGHVNLEMEGIIGIFFPQLYFLKVIDALTSVFLFTSCKNIRRVLLDHSKIPFSLGPSSTACDGQILCFYSSRSLDSERKKEPRRGSAEKGEGYHASDHSPPHFLCSSIPSLPFQIH